MAQNETGNDTILRGAARHVAYDVRMLRRAYERHQRCPFAYTAWFVHCRSLMAFFAERLVRDGIVASDFLPGEVAWAELVASFDEPRRYGEVRRAADRIASPPSNRIESDLDEGSAAVMPDEEITSYLLELMELFLKTVAPERRGWFGGVWLRVA